MNNMLSVITLNLRFGLADDGSNNWDHRKKCFPYLFDKYPADFIGLQEANDFQTDFLKNILTEYRFIGKRDPAPLFWQNNIIFYKKTWKCIHSEHFFLSPTPMIPSRSRKSLWPRQCTIGIFESNDHSLIYINTHFDFDPTIQVKSAELIMKRLSRLPSELPVILTGDFNATTSCPCYKMLTGQNKKSNSTNKLYFKNTFSEPFPGTHHGFSGNRNGDHIDWILYRGRIIPMDCKVVHDKIYGIYLSDHFPLYAKFKWEKNKTNN